MSTLVSPGSVQEALEMVRAGLGYLAAADATAMAAEEQARCLHGLEQATSVLTAARSSVLCAFAAGQGTHPQGMDALAAEEMSESLARTLCQWTDKLPEDCRAAAHEILIAAAAAGMGDAGPGRAVRRDLRAIPVPVAR